eukprot:CAMPEP_0119005548 /NCGR_PEP_ID=MMETSP1176-20130426/1788_1 /TAXON_ID=265551 /ORGANISM="Synedropsis recta cf, Strain CCMP1620" /LENGTH=465 /DNA_ID=CAMNT_0006957375 /DNA_START=16 /DNA_END=1413 /DNA_ORIENTATION=+
MSLDLGSFRFDTGGTSNRNQALSWRMDPEESLSDWTIDINKRDTYNVHKSFLAAGKRSSLYFERLVHSVMSETTDSVSRIDLELSAAHAFPAMLDYMYYHDDEVKATTYTAVALRYLANYFEMEELFNSVNRFIQEDFSTDTALTYIVESCLYNDAKLFDVAGHECALQFSELPEDKLLQLSPEALHQIVTSPNFSGDSYLLSRLVARVCEAHPDMDTKLLEEMTTFVRMPTVDPEVALSLLKSAMTRPTEVATLRNRTVKAASEQWLDLAKCLEDKVVHAYYSTLGDPVKVKVLEKSLIQARSDTGLLEEEKKDLRKEVKEKNRDLKKRQKLIAEAVDSTKEELTREFQATLQEFSNQIQQEAQTAFEEKEAIIVDLQKQLAEMTLRLKNNGNSKINNSENATSIKPTLVTKEKRSSSVRRRSKTPTATRRPSASNPAIPSIPSINSMSNVIIPGEGSLSSRTL